MRAWRCLYIFPRCSCAYVKSNTNSRILSLHKVESRDETQEHKKKNERTVLQKLFPLAVRGPKTEKTKIELKNHELNYRS